MAEPVALTVVIAVLDAGPQLSEQLEGLAVQQFSGAWEVVVADNGSSDGSMSLAGAFADRLPLTIVDASGRRGQGHTRNVGAAAGLGRHVVFLDQDDVVSSGYLTSMDAALDQSTIVAARIDTATLNDPRLAGWRVMAQERSLGHGFGFLPYGAGGTIGVRRQAFELVGGFDPAMPGGAEDVDLCWRVQLATGEQMQFAPDALLHYRLRSGILPVARQGRGHGQAEVALRRRYGRLGVPRRVRGRMRNLGGLTLRAAGSRRLSDLYRLAWAAGHLTGTFGARTRIGGHQGDR